MKRVIAFLKSTWFITLIGALALSVIIWLIGPLIAIADVRPLESELVRGITVLVIILAWGLYNTLRLMRAQRTDQQMVTNIAAAAKEGGTADAAEAGAEIAALRQRLEEALVLLKKSTGGKGGQRYLYQLPWYMLIGPPGSGKSTALLNSGLNFPLAQRYGKDPVRGVGGTRNCDWWFTDDAVLLDTAGRYTTQDSHEATDAAAWKGFLSLLKKFRPRQPINGALVAISISDIAGLPQGERLAHARAIRQRLAELHEEFRVRFPIYVLLTKADLVAGFVEYFDDLGREEREQVWGATLPLDDGSERGVPAIAEFGGEFDALVERLNQRLLTRLQQETDMGKRAALWGFPAQIASLKQPLVEFLNEIFAPNRYESRALLRGIYFTSGTQEGTPIDRLMGAMAAKFGIDRQRLAAFSGAGRSYFLTQLLRRVVFAEASVVSSNPAVERRQAWLRRGAYAGAVLGLAACCAAWTMSYFNNRALIAAADQQLAGYTQAVTPFAKPVVADEDLEKILPALRILRDMPAGYEQQKQSVPLGETFGLYQGDKLGPAAVSAYRRALNNVFRPRLLVHLGNEMRRRAGEPEYVQAALKAYLMLGGSAKTIDKDFLKLALAYDWEASYPGAERAAMRQELAGHLDALLEQTAEPIALDRAVIDGARAVLLKSPLASRAYGLIKQSDKARQLPEWRISDHAGPAADRVLARQGGTLTSGVPGLYTYDGYQKVFLAQLGSVSATMARESWVLGDNAPATNTGQLESEVASLYMTDYMGQWDRLLREVNVAPFHGMREAADALNVLSSPNSPLKLLYTAIAAETNLTRPPPLDPKNPAAAAQNAASQAADKAAAAAPDSLKKLIAGNNPLARPAYGQIVTDHFKWLQDYVGEGNGKAPIDDTIRALNDAYLQINGLAQAGGDAKAKPSSGGALDALKTASTRVPPSVGGILAQIQKNASNVATGGLREQIRDEWTTKVLPFCRNAVDDRYPMVRTSANDVNLDDFTRLFAPNGLIDAFFSADLKPFVDTSRAPWRWQKVGDVDLGFSADALLQFQRAAAIRDGFFPAGAATPSLRLELTPVSLDAKSTQVLVEVDGQEIAYRHDPPRPAQLRWPGQAGAQGGRVAFSPQTPDQPSSLTREGPWSLFRLFDAATIEGRGQADRARLSFTIGNHSATYDLRANSVINPLTMKELGEFRCPHL